MNRWLSFVLIVLLMAPAAQPGEANFAAWKWQRVITPNALSPLAEQCAVLDAALFAGAAPGLRDVRLVQDGRELAFATDISQDDRGARGLNANGEERALYETALVVPAHAAQWPGAPGNGDAALHPEHPTGWFYGQALLPAHVPVERLRLESPVKGNELLSLRAAEAERPEDAESVEATLTPEHPSLAFTLGANLQTDAEVRLGAHGDGAVVSAFVLEMRRREICYQPMGRSPVMLFFGNSKALPVHYAFSRDFLPKASPLLSEIGPVRFNPAFQALGLPQASPLRGRLILAILAGALTLALTLGLLLPPRRGR